MKVEEYVAARYGRLVERAIELGAPEGQAWAYVDQVLADNRRGIKRAKDPDPLIHDKLEQALRGHQQRRPFAPYVAVAVVVAAVLVGVLVTYRPTPATTPLPSAFGYDGPSAATYLQHKGYDVALRQVSACAPLGVVVASRPSPGSLVAKGDTVDVFTAVPSVSFCVPNYDDLVDAYAFVHFALGGPPVSLAETLTVIVDEPTVKLVEISSPSQGPQWGTSLPIVAAAAGSTAPTLDGMAHLDVTAGVPPRQWCGRSRPIEVGRRPALRLLVDARPEGDRTGCPVTVDLYRVGRTIDTVVVYPAA